MTLEHRGRALHGTVLVLAVGLLCLDAARANAKGPHGSAFPEVVEAQGVSFTLVGTGVLRWKLLFRPYAAAFWVADGDGNPADFAADKPKRLEIEYYYAFKAGDFAWATWEGMAASSDSESIEHMRARIERFNALYRDIRPGDRYAITYVPGRGTELALNGEALGTVEGPDLAAGLFGIWLGEKPLSDSLKAQLLTRR
jgi:hypothetical protein